MTILLCDPRVAAIPVIGSTEPLVRLGRPYGPDRAWVRAGLARRLDQAQASLPVGIRFGVVEGHLRSSRATPPRSARFGRVFPRASSTT
jgi:D-alanyl-D-alanine dipeptidase